MDACRQPQREAVVMISVLMFASQVYAIEIPHEAFELENGLEVMLLEDHRLPQVVVDV